MGNFEESANLVELGVNWIVILKWILKKKNDDDVGWIHLAQHMDKWVGSCEHGNGISRSIKYEKSFDCL